MGEQMFDPRQETDEELVEWMSLKDMSEMAQAAFDELYKRHVNYLVSVCTRAFSDFLDDHDIEELVQETFIRGYERAETFKKSGLDRDKGRRLVRGWFSKIAERLYLDELRARRREIKTSPLGEDDGAKEKALRDLSDRLTEHELLVRDALRLLDPQELEVIREYLRHYDPERKVQRSPEGVVTELEARLATTAENIRQIRKRAFGKIRQFLIAQGVTETLHERSQHVKSAR